MATNVSFFRAFAADKTTVTAKNVAYYFEHSRDDFANLFDADSPTDDQIKMFHYTTAIVPEVNESSFVDGVRYTGEILMLLKSDLDEVIDVQKGTDIENGQYELYIKPMIEDGGILKHIVDYNACNTDYELDFTDIKEVYNMFDWNGSGIFFQYEVFIPV